MAGRSPGPQPPSVGAKTAAPSPVVGRDPRQTAATNPVPRHTSMGSRHLLATIWSLAATAPALAAPPLSLGLQTMAGPAAVFHALSALPGNSATPPAPGGLSLDALPPAVAAGTAWPTGAQLNPLSPTAPIGTATNRLVDGSETALAPPGRPHGKPHPLGGMPPQRAQPPSVQDLPAIDLSVAPPARKSTPPIGSVPHDNRPLPRS